MADKKRGWRNPPKYIEPTTTGKCPYCKKEFNSLEKHIHDRHKSEKDYETTLSNIRSKGFDKKYPRD